MTHSLVRQTTGLGITGTDTGVGKTLVASAIIAMMREAGLRAAPMKPIETGNGDDGELLCHAAGDIYPLELIRPYYFSEPIAPLVAARRAHGIIDVEVLDRAFNTLHSSSDIMVVEGAGGIRVPITESMDTAALFQRWSLDVVIVAANRLGAINHTLLTVDAVLARGLTIRAVVLNTMSGDQQGPAERTNQAVLKEALRTIPVTIFPHTPKPHDPANLANLARGLAITSVARPA